MAAHKHYWAVVDHKGSKETAENIIGAKQTVGERILKYWSHIISKSTLQRKKQMRTWEALNWHWIRLHGASPLTPLHFGARGPKPSSLRPPQTRLTGAKMKNSPGCFGDRIQASLGSIQCPSHYPACCLQDPKKRGSPV